ncbi:MAG TPA: S53 family peptidase, partial [Thermoplasmata archaeon]|nr:S53 family peptidase [Thermoplasmata archaeon]
MHSPRRPAGRFWVVPAFLLVVLVVPPVPGLGVPVPALLGGAAVPGARGVVSSPAVAIPSSLLAPWAERSGFNGTLLDDATDLGSAQGSVRVVVSLWPSNATFFDPLPEGAPPMSVPEIGQEYGVSPSEYAALEGYFVSRGLTIDHAWPDRTSLTVEGPASVVGPAFGTSLLSGEIRGRPLMFPATVPRLPGPFSQEVAAISGLGSSTPALEIPFEPLSSDVSPAPDQGSTSDYVTPNDVHVLYDLNSLYNFSGTTNWATGQGIAVLLWGSGYDPSDLSTFFSRNYPGGFPQPVVQSYPVDGAPAPSAGAVNDPSNSTREMTLDIEWAASEAPGATIDAVYAPDGPASNGYSPLDATMEDAAHEAATGIAGVRVISMSFGSLDGSDPPFQAAMSLDFAAATRQGITLVAASGDTGGAAKDSCGGGPGPQFPAASPQVLSVGGTAPVMQLSAFGTVQGIDSEPDWSLSGGGYSASYAAPSWQLTGSAKDPIEQNGSMRGMPDVSGPANRNYFYFDGSQEQGSGTSFATPMWAGLIAEMDALRGSPFGFITDRIYLLGTEEAGGSSGGLVDITAGAPTCIATAVRGWDAATG